MSLTLMGCTQKRNAFRIHWTAPEFAITGGVSFLHLPLYNGLESGTHEGIVRSGMSLSGGWERKPPGTK